MPDGGEACLLQHLDEPRKVPEGHGFRRREAVLDLAQGQIGLDAVRVEEVRRFVGRRDPRLFQIPVPVRETGRCRIDSSAEPVVVIEPKNDDVLQLGRVGHDAQRVHNRLTVAIGLSQPQPRRRHRKQARLST